MQFVSAHKQSDEATLVLSPAKWQEEFVLIANAKGQETCICHDHIHHILSPAIYATCLLTPKQTLFFSTPSSNGGRFGGRLTPSPSEATPHTTGDTCPTVTARPGHTTKPNTTRQQYRGGLNPEVEYSPQRFLPPNTMGSCGNRPPARGSHGRYCSGLIRRIGVPTLGPKIHLFPTAPGSGGQTRLPHSTR